MATVTSFQKEAEKLAKQVRELGYECEARDGHSFLVWKKGTVKILASFPAHPSHADWRGQSLSALRKAGIIIDTRNGGLKVEVTPEQSDKLMERLAPFVATDEARNQFIRDAVRVLDEAHARGERTDIEQFGASPLSSGKSSPVDIARQSLKQLVTKGGTTKEKPLTRWTAILDLVEADQQRRAEEPETPEEVASTPVEPVAEEEGATAGPTVFADEDEVAGAVEEQSEATDAELVRESESQLEKMREDAEAAERLMHEADERAREAEAKLEKASERADKAESNVRVLRERVKTAEAAVEEAQKAATTAKRAATRWENRARAAEEQLEGEGDQPEPTKPAEAEIVSMEVEVTADVGAFREQLGTALIDLLGTTEYAESPPQWLLDRVDKLAGLK